MYTKGPWATGHDGHGGMYIESGDGQIGFIRSGNNQSANARLIAAAPDLLEACEDTLSGLDAEYGARVVDVNFPKLRAAIVKANGQRSA